MQDCFIYERIIDIITGKVELNINRLVLPGIIKSSANAIERKRKELIDRGVLTFGFVNFLLKIQELKENLKCLLNNETNNKKNFNLFIYINMCDCLINIVKKYYMPEIYAKTLILFFAPTINPEKVKNIVLSQMYSNEILLGLNKKSNIRKRQTTLLDEKDMGQRIKFGDIFASIRLREKSKMELIILTKKLKSLEELNFRCEKIIDSLVLFDNDPVFNLFRVLFLEVYEELLGNLEELKKQNLVDIPGDSSQLSLFKS